MKERPILFSGPMVRAILDGRKTQTRRIINPQPAIWAETDAAWRDSKSDLWRNSKQYARDCSPYGVAGDRLWVREMLRRPDGDPWVYAADKLPVMVRAEDETAMVVWAHHKQQNYCPSMFMPRWASRITLEVTDVRVQRLQEITDEDAIAEGSQIACAELPRGDCQQAAWTERQAFSRIWDSINAERAPWASNPWVWAVTFLPAAAEGAVQAKAEEQK